MRLLICFFLFSSYSLTAQIKGNITDVNGEPLAYATIYEQNTNKGTTSNLDGEYELDLSPGAHTLVFQYVGYKTDIRSIIAPAIGEELRLDIQLQTESYSLDQVVIAADAEDPAYRVIREAIKKRPYYLSNLQKYVADVYVKGNTKILKAPEKILGMKVGDMEGALDSNRQGMVYLSESVSKLYFQAPDNIKEVMISSKTSGDDQGYSFNSASDMDINFYRNTVDQVNRSLVSPIADNALGFYKYKLLGTQYDDKGRLINKIQVIPKRANDPIVQGTIYIVEDQWNIESLSLYALPEATRVYFLDTLSITQQYINQELNDDWLLFSNTATFQMGLFGFEFEGVFSAFYSNYDLDIDIKDGFFGNELIKVEENSNKKDSTYWEATRPIPLTAEEGLDYVKKDSIYEARHTPEYLDSIDRNNNEFGFLDPLTGYSYQKSRKHLFINFNSPLENIDFNTIQGYSTAAKLSILKYKDENRFSHFRSSTNINYGFSDNKFRGYQQFEIGFNSIDYSRLRIGGGVQLVQFGEREIISPIVNSTYSLFFRQNYLRLFEKKNIKLEYRREMGGGVWIYSEAEYAQKSAVNNSSNSSYFYQDSREYSSNNPLDSRSEGQSLFQDYSGTYLNLNISFRPGQKYMSYPNQRYFLSNTKPRFSLIWRGGFGDNLNFHELALVMRGNQSLKTWGTFKYRLRAGTFINGEDIPFPEFRHFTGNEYVVTSGINYAQTFLNLPYHTDSANGNYFEGHLEQNFTGRIIDRIPILKKTGFYLVAGAKYLYTENQGHYNELHLGLDNIGFKFFRGLRFDAVWSFREGNHVDTGFVLKLDLFE